MLQPHVKSDKGTTSVSFSTPADLRLAFLREENSNVTYCAEPMPDVALGSQQSASGSLNAAASLAQNASAATSATLAAENEALRKDLREAIIAYESATNREYSQSLSSNVSSSVSSSGSVNLQAAYSLAVSVSELGGRSQGVLLAREFLYRLCEARANKFIQSEQAYIELQNNALKLIQSISAPVRPSPATERAELAKRLTEYVAKQSDHCAAKQKACLAVAADEAAKKTCAADYAKCLSAIDATLPAEDKAAPRSVPRTEFELSVPKLP